MAAGPLTDDVRAALATPATWPGPLEAHTPIMRALARVPAGYVITTADLQALDRMTTELPDVPARTQAAAVAVLAAWHVEPGAVHRRIGTVVALAAELAQALPVSADSLVAIDALIDPVTSFATLLGDLGPVPADAVAVLSVGAQVHMEAGGLERATALIGAAAEIEVTTAALSPPTRQTLERFAGALAATTATVPASVAVLDLLVRSYDLLGQHAVAQTARLGLIQTLSGLDLPQQVLRLLPDAVEPVVAPGQAESVAWARALALRSLGRSEEARAAVDELSERIPRTHPARTEIGAALASLDAEHGRWGAAREALAPAVAAALAQGVVPEPRASAHTRLLLQDADWALRLGQVQDVLARRDQIAALATASAFAATVAAPMAAALAAEAAGQPPAAEGLWHAARHAVDGWQRQAQERVSSAGLASMIVEIDGRLTVLAARRGDAVAALASAERSRADLLRAGAAAVRDPAGDSGVAGFLDAARRRLAAGDDTGTLGGLGTLAAGAVDALRDRPLQQLLLTPPAPEGDPFAAVSQLLGDAGPGWLAVSVTWAADAVVTTATDGVTVWTEAVPLDDPALSRELVAVFTRSAGAGPAPTEDVWRARADRCLLALEPLLAGPLLRMVAGSGRRRVLLSVPGVLACVPLLAVGSLLDDLAALTVVPGLVLAAESTRRWWDTATTDPAAAAVAAQVGLPRPRAGAVVGAAIDDTIPAAALEAALVGLLRPPPVTVHAPIDQAALVSEVPGAAVVHLACHASWSTERVADGGMQIGTDRLDAGELLVALDLRAADLVVLSACDTASSMLAPGGEAVNLASMVQLAGARRVVASLWPVRDDAAALFATELHARLAAGARPAEATRDAVLRLRSLTCADAVAVADRWRASLSAVPEGGLPAGVLDTVEDLQHDWRRRPPDAPLLDRVAWMPFSCFGVP